MKRVFFSSQFWVEVHHGAYIVTTGAWVSWSYHIQTQEQNNRNAYVLISFLAYTQLDFPTLRQFRIPHLGNCTTHSGLGIHTPINLMMTIPSHRHAHRTPQCKHSLFENLSQEILGCAKLTMKANNHKYNDQLAKL